MISQEKFCAELGILKPLKVKIDWVFADFELGICKFVLGNTTFPICLQ